MVRVFDLGAPGDHETSWDYVKGEEILGSSELGGCCSVLLSSVVCVFAMAKSAAIIKDHIICIVMVPIKKHDI